MQASDTPTGPGAAAQLSIRRVPPARVLAWLAAGWADWRRNMAPLSWLSAGLLLVAWLLGGSLASFVTAGVATVYLGVVAAWCRLAERGQVIATGKGVWRNRALRGLAVVVSLAWLVPGAIFALVLEQAAQPGWGSGGQTGLGWFYFIGAAQVVVTLLLSGLWMAPALVVNRGVGLVQAIRLSLIGSARNAPAFLAALVLGLVLLVVASIPLGLGLVVALPMLALAAARAADEIVV